MSRIRFILTTFLLLICMVFWSACGRKGDPYPRKELHKPGTAKAAPQGEPHG
jgi:hypothetical protein